ncbi:MAG: hypothetical protein J6N76_04260 [Lachnospiraceae bacterium]|nr:hypothetical protein [Lachnospiraceae bacterium]
MGRQRATVTIFMSLVIVMIMSLIFSLVEVVHLHCLSKKCDMLITAGAESIMAEYNRLLWKDYGILAVDMGYNEIGINTDKACERSLPYMDGRESSDFLGIDTGVPSITGYRLLSDQNGDALIREAVIQETLELPGQLISDLSNLCTIGEAALKGSEDVDTLLSQGESAEAEADKIWADAQEAAKKTAESNAAAEGKDPAAASGFTPTPRPGSDVENPAPAVKEWKKGPLLGQVLPVETPISTEGIDDINRPSERSLDTGTCSEPIATGFTDKILYAAYLKNHFGCYTNQLGHSGAAYEWEYVICGEETDKDNLQEVVGILLAFRVAENFASMAASQAKQEEATALATLLVGWTANDAIISGVSKAITAAWVYVESVLDVRTLLSGGRVSVLKTESEWTSNLTNIGTCMDVHTKAKESDYGLAYEEYLLLLTCLHFAGDMGMRSLDVLEDALHRHTEYAYCYVDQLAVELYMEDKFFAEPIFISVVPAFLGSINSYEFSRSKNISYLTPLL